VAVGLALQGLDSASATINLLPENFIIQRELHSKRFSSLIAAALIWAIVGCLYAGGKQTLQELAKLEGIGQNTLDQVAKLDKDLKDAQGGKIAQRAEPFQNFGRHREYYSRLVGAVSAVMPREVQIDKFSFTDETSIGAAMAGPAGAQPGGRASFENVRPPFAGPAGARPSAAAGPGGPGAAAPTPEETLLSQASIVLTFTATCDADKNPTWLQKNLPQELAKAVIYPDKIGAIKADDKGHLAIVVGEVRLTENRPTVSSRTSQSMPRVPGAPTTSMVSAAAAPDIEFADIKIGLITPKEADKLLADLADKRAKEAEEKAAAAAANPAESAPPAQKPPSPGLKP
jgi:hypothetical protein